MALQHKKKQISCSSLNLHSVKGHILELVVFGAACFSEEPLAQLLQVSAVVHLNLGLLSEEVLQVLEKLHPQLTLLVQTFELLCQLGTDLCRSKKKKKKNRVECIC